MDRKEELAEKEEEQLCDRRGTPLQAQLPQGIAVREKSREVKKKAH